MRRYLRQHDSRKVLVGNTCELQRAIEGFATHNLFEGGVLFLAVAHGLKRGGVVVERLLLVAKAARPRQERTHRRAVAQDRDRQS